MFYGNGGWNPWMLALMVCGMLLFWGFPFGVPLFTFADRARGLADHSSIQGRS